MTTQPTLIIRAKGTKGDLGPQGDQGDRGTSGLLGLDLSEPFLTDDGAIAFDVNSANIGMTADGVGYYDTDPTTIPPEEQAGYNAATRTIGHIAPELWEAPNMGPPGTDGAAGAPGDTAYDIAVKNGFVGTESQWLASLISTVPGPRGYGVGGNQLSRWKEVRSLASSRAVNLLFVGDSITEGTGATAKANRWQDLLIPSLRSSYPSAAAGGAGYIPAAYITTSFSTPWTFGGTVTAGTYAANSTTFGLGIRYIRLSSAATATLTFTGTAIDIFFATGSSGAAFTYTIDGGAASSSWSTTATNLNDGNKRSITGLSAGSHTIVITAAANYLYLEGAYVYNGDESIGIRGWDAGHHSYRAADFVDDINQYAYGLAQPDLVVMMFGTNEYGSSSRDRLAPSTLVSNMRQLIRRIKQTCTHGDPSVLIMIPYKRGDTITPTPFYPWSDYTTAITAFAAQDDYATLDLGTVIGDLSVSNAAGLGASDLLHPSNSGHAAIAAALASTLTAA